MCKDGGDESSDTSDLAMLGFLLWFSNLWDGESSRC